MRELKFRVWFDNVKRGENKGDEIIWHTVSYYGYDPIIDNGGLLEVEGGWDIFGHSDENYTIEQYTGLKDKNGKEIYEGDIVTFMVERFDSITLGFESEDWHTAVVEWEQDDASYSFMDGNEPFSVRFEAEVIGNIHENPELIGKEKQ